LQEKENQSFKDSPHILTIYILGPKALNITRERKKENILVQFVTHQIPQSKKVWKGDLSSTCAFCQIHRHKKIRNERRGYIVIRRVRNAAQLSYHDPEFESISTNNARSYTVMLWVWSSAQLSYRDSEFQSISMRTVTLLCNGFGILPNYRIMILSSIPYQGTHTCANI
jgi:hypothetical protein